MKRNLLRSLLCVILLLLAVILGKVIGGAVVGVPAMAWLNQGASFGFDPVTLDLAVIKLTLGFSIEINAAQILLMVAAIFAYSKIRIQK